MHNNNSLTHRSNIFLFLAATLGLLFVVLLLIPYLTHPAVARTATAFRVALQITITPSAPPAARATPTPPPPTVTPTPRAKGNCRRYTVQPGETLLTLADRLGVPVAILALTNDLHDDALVPGHILVICTPSSLHVPSGPAETETGAQPPALAQVEVLMILTYPRKIYTRQPQWITLTVRPLREGVMAEGLLPEVEKAIRQTPVIIEPAPLPPPELGMVLSGGERWLEAQLTGRNVVLRSGTMQMAQAMQQMMGPASSLEWQWLFTPPEAGRYLFGLDVFAADEYRVRRPNGDIVRERSSPRRVWSQNFTISVDEIFGIPRRWWVLVSALGAFMNVILAVVQIMAQ